MSLHNLDLDVLLGLDCFGDPTYHDLTTNECKRCVDSADCSKAVRLIEKGDINMSQMEEIQKMKESGMTLQAIADELNVSSSTVSRKLKKAESNKAPAKAKKGKAKTKPKTKTKKTPAKKVGAKKKTKTKKKEKAKKIEIPEGEPQVIKFKDNKAPSARLMDVSMAVAGMSDSQLMIKQNRTTVAVRIPGNRGNVLVFFNPSPGSKDATSIGVRSDYLPKNYPGVALNDLGKLSVTFKDPDLEEVIKLSSSVLKKAGLLN